MRRTLYLPALLLATALLASCTGDPSGSRDGPLQAKAHAPWLDLVNSGSRPVYYIVVDESKAGLLLWAPCTNPGACDGVGPRDKVRISYGDIVGYSPGSTGAIVYWWHLEPTHFGFRADSVRMLSVRL